MKLFVLCLLACGACADVDLITEPRPGEEYVLVSSGQQTPLRDFETAHKIPEKHPVTRVARPDDAPDRVVKKFHLKNARHPSEGIVSIEEDKRIHLKKGYKGKVTESVELDVPVSKLEEHRIKENTKNVDTNPKMAVALEAMSESGKLNDSPGTTTQKPTLTTSAPTSAKPFDYIPINFDTIDDINAGLLSSNANLEPAGSEQKQHSRIQVKKGPNGQDYEYEYIYYYYDDDEEVKKKGDKGQSSSEAPVHNSHDGPQKAEADNHIPKDKNRNKYNTIDRSASTTPAAQTLSPEVNNEVLPTSARGRQRGRNIVPAPVQEEVVEDRLPSSTRFPPRGRALTPAAPSTPAEAPEAAVKQRSRAQFDSVADESIGNTRSRTRAHVRRPSSELVDLDSFKTGDIPTQHKEQPSRYAAESKTTTEGLDIMVPKEPHSKEPAREGHSLTPLIRFQEVLDESKLPADYKSTTAFEHDTTEPTTMTAMEKVALDLYAYSYLNEEGLTNDVSPTAGEYSTTEEESWTTEALSTTEEATTVTTTTTTTTTTPPPTTTTAAPSTRPSRFKLRPGARGRSSTTTTTTEASETSTKVRGRFGKPKTGGRRTTAAAAEASAAASTAAPLEKSTQAPKQSFGRRGLFAGRTRPPSTTAAPSGDAATPATGDTPTPRVLLRPGLRRLPSSTAAPGTAAEAESSASQDPAETTTASGRLIGRGRPGLRPLRPGPRLNLRPSPRLRAGDAEPAPDAAAATAAPEAPATEADSSESPSSTAATEAPSRGGIKLRTRLIAPSPKPRVAVTQPPRRPNPLLKRKQASTEATTEARAKVEEETEPSTSAERAATETDATPAETTPTPPLRGLDALFARRRAAQAAGRTSRPVRRA